MRDSRVRRAWKQLKKGQGFFVPCLDFEKMRQHGLSRAISMRILDAHAVAGVKDGAAGVYFFRKPSVPRTGARSAS